MRNNIEFNKWRQKMVLDKPKENVKKQDLKRLVNYALHFPLHLFLGLFFLIIAIGFELIAPFAVKKIFDTELKMAVINKAAILKWILLYIASNLIGIIFQYISGIELQVMAMKIVKKMRIQIFKNLQRIHISFFDNSPAGSIVSKITNDTNAVQALYVRVLGKILKSIMYVVGVYVIMFKIQPRLAFLFLFLIPVISALIIFYNKKAKKYNVLIRKKVSELNGSLNESVQGITIIQSFNSEDKIEKEFHTTNNEKYKEGKKLLLLNVLTSYNAINILNDLIFLILIFYFGSKSIRYKDLVTVGMLHVYVDYIGILFHHIRLIIEQVNVMAKSTAASSQVFEMIDMQGKDLRFEKLKLVKGKVKFENVSFAYKENDYVLKNININAEAGETIALVGHTGSGKSSIMNLLLKFYETKEGRILIDEMDLSKLPDQAIREQMGIVLQESYLFSGTVLSNITLNNPNVSRETAKKALEMIGGELVTKNLKKGIDEEVVERGSTLSSGQRQLISFARALAQNPKILILDEATSSVDSETEQIIQNAMNILMKDRTTFIIAHRLSTIKNADKIYLLEKGRVIEEGNHEELILKKGKYYDMYQAQNSLT